MIELWKSLTSWLRSPIPEPTPPSLLESSLPVESATVTLSGASPSMLEATRWTTACTWPGSRLVPGVVASSTEAVAGSCLSAKTCLVGSARWTTALPTPSRAPTVLESSPSMARLKSVCSLNCEVDRSWLSRIE